MRQRQCALSVIKRKEKRKTARCRLQVVPFLLDALSEIVNLNSKEKNTAVQILGVISMV